MTAKTAKCPRCGTVVAKAGGLYRCPKDGGFEPNPFAYSGRYSTGTVVRDAIEGSRDFEPPRFDMDPDDPVDLTRKIR